MSSFNVDIQSPERLEKSDQYQLVECALATSKGEKSEGQPLSVFLIILMIMIIIIMIIIINYIFWIRSPSPRGALH